MHSIIPTMKHRTVVNHEIKIMLPATKGSVMQKEVFGGFGVGPYIWGLALRVEEVLYHFSHSVRPMLWISGANKECRV